MKMNKPCSLGALASAATLVITATLSLIPAAAHGQLAPGVSLNFDANYPLSGVDSDNWNSLTADISKDMDFGADVTLETVTTSFAGINKAYRFTGGAADNNNPTWDSQYGDGSATTWELWIKPADTGDAEAQCITESGGSGTGYAIWYAKGSDADGSGTINFTIDGGSGAQVETVRAVIDTSEFRHVTCLYKVDGGGGGIDLMQIWIDGVLIDDNLSANPDADATNDNDNLNIPDWSGSDGSGFGDTNNSFADNIANGEFQGDVSVFRVWGNKALSEREIVGNFNTGKTAASFAVNAGTDSDGDEYWEDFTPGNPSGLGLLFDDSPAVTREVIIGSDTLLTHAYEFPGGFTGNEAGALLVASDTTTVQSFQNAPGDWSNNAMSLEVWFKPDDLLAGNSPANGQIIFEDGGGTGLGLFIDANELVCGQDSNSPLISYDLVTDSIDVIDDTTTPTSEFTQVIVTRTQPGATTLYINGTQVGTASDDTDWTGGDPAAFGTLGGVNTGGRGGGQASTESFDGQIALIRVYDSLVLTAAQVQENYDALTGPDTFGPEIVTLSPVDDDPVVVGNSDLVVEFSEAIQIGTGEIRIVNETDLVTTTIDVVTDASQISVSGATLTITPTVALIGGKDYHVEFDDTGVEDESGNAFDGISDADTWNFTVEGTPPTLDTFADNKPGGQIYDSGSVTYTLIFSEDLNASTVEAGDFSNNGTAGITVDSVTAVSDSVYEVVISPTSTGTIQLQVAALAIIEDLSGNALDTSSAIQAPSVIDVLPFVANPSSFVVGFQATLASQENGNSGGEEGGPYHVSVNANNPGYAGLSPDLPNSGDPATPFQRSFTDPVLSWSFVGGGTNGVLAVAQESGGLISYTTTDVTDPVSNTFDSFGQDQRRLWTTSDPGPDLLNPTTTEDSQGPGYRSLGQVAASINISGLASGTLNIFYGAYNETPKVTVVMRDSSGLEPDIIVADAHISGDSANLGEYYIAELDFVNDGNGSYDTIEYEWLANGTNNTGNGLFGGTVLTGTAPAPLVKDDNTDDLNLGTSWVGGSAPGPIDTGLWDITVSGSNSTVLGADLNWNAVAVRDPGGDVTIGGANTLTLNGYGVSGTAIDMSNATVDLNISSGLAMTDGETWNVASGRTLSISGAISGSSGIDLVGDGTAVLSGANTFSGDTAINSGTLRLGAIDVIPNGTGNGDVSVSGTLDLNGNSDTVNGLLGNGVIDNSAGSTTAILTAGDDDQSTTFSGTLQNSGGSATLSLQKTGSGTLSLSGANTHSGGITLSSGTVIFDSATALGSGTITFDNGGAAPATSVFSTASTYLNPVTVAAGSAAVNTIQSTNGSGTVKLDGAVTINAGTTLTLDNSGSVFDIGTGVITGGGILEATGSSAGNFIFRGANTYSGGTLLSGSGIYVPALSSTGPGGSPTDGPFGTGTLTLNGIGMRSTTIADTLIGNPLVLAGDFTGITNGSEKNLSFNGPVTLTGNRTITTTIGQTVAGRTLTFSGAIDDGASTFSLTKQGAGVLVLTGANSFGGNLAIGAGTVRVGSDFSAGNGGQIIGNSGAGNTTFASADATALTFTKTVSTNQANGGITFGDTTGTGDLTFTGGLTRAGGATNRTTNVIGSTIVTFNGNLTSPGTPNANTTFTKGGTGTLAIKGTGSGTDLGFSRIVVTGGAMAVTRLADLGVASSLSRAANATPGAVSITLDNAELLYIDGGAAASSTNRLLQIGRTTDNRSGTIRNNATDAVETVTFSNTDAIAYGTVDQTRTLVLGGTNTGANTFASEIGDNGTAAAGLSKEDPGTWVLSGTNTYTGPTTVTGGTLSLGVNDCLADTSPMEVGGGTLGLPASISDTVGTLDCTAGATIDLGTGATLAFADSSAIDWTGGTLDITGDYVSGSSLRFGTTSGGLTAAQLLLITVNGGSSSFSLDASGYLVGGTVSGYAAWAAANAGGQAPELDFDNDGVENGIEFFLDAAPGFTASATLDGTNTISWTNGGNLPASGYGTDFVIQTSSDLQNWDPVLVGDLASNTDGPGGLLSYTLTGPAPLFVRLQVTVAFP